MVTDQNIRDLQIMGSKSKDSLCLHGRSDRVGGLYSNKRNEHISRMIWILREVSNTAECFFDTNMSMTQNIQKVVCKAEKVIKALEGVIRNAGGPNSQKKKVLMTTAYAVWCKCMVEADKSYSGSY